MGIEIGVGDCYSDYGQNASVSNQAPKFKIQIIMLLLYCI